MDANSFIKSLGTADLAIHGPAPDLQMPYQVDEPVIFSNLTPSGILVEYSPAPRRFYRVNGTEVPSVTSVLDCLEKGGLPWWGMKVGVQGVVELFEKGLLQTFVDWKDGDKEKVCLVGDAEAEGGLRHGWQATTESIVDLLKQEKLTVNHVRDKAGERGTNVHDALEQWAKSGGEFFPTPAEFPEAERGYVEGLLAWIDDLQPKPVLWEVMVGSELGYAGRYDLVVEPDAPCEYVSKTYPKKDDKVEELQPGRYMVDLKTSKGVYPTSNFRQLAAYEWASRECGYPNTDSQYILRVTSDGKYEFVRSTAVLADFVPVLNVWQSNQGLK